MPRGTRGGYTSSRGSSYRGGGGGRGSWHSSSRGYNNTSRGGGGRFNSSSHHNSFSSNAYDRKYSSSSDKYGGGSRSHHNEDYRRPYKNDTSGYHNRDQRSPERKRMRTESSHDRSFGGSGGEYKGRYENNRRSFSNDRRVSSYTRKDEFRKPQPPPSSPRGGYRGRANSSRGGALRARLRDRPIRKRLVESSYAVRRRVLSGRTSDYARRLKMNKLRSTIIRRKNASSDKDSDDDDEKKSIKDESATEGSDKEKGDTKDDIKSPKKEKKEEASDNEAKKDSDAETEKKSSRFIKLTCPHCQIGFSTFGKYLLHLQSGRHAASMRRVATKQKTILSQMRLVQRKAQRELEKTTEDLAPRTSWCPMCKLNYKQPKATHQASKSHLDMKRFLMPHCKICKMTFKSPMIFESHCCSLDHIKRKATLSDKSEKEESGNDEDLGGNFMTIDSVGDVDEDGDLAVKEEKSKEHVNVGIEEIHKVEVHYCDLCRMYLPRVNDEDEMNKEIARHCKQRTHLQKYIRYKEDKELAKKAERLVRKENAEKEKEKVDNKETGQSKESETDETKADDTLTEDHKIYEMCLTEETPKSEDEDEDEEDSIVNGGERYDRFRQSEKNAEDKKVVEPTGDEEPKIEVTPEDVKI